LAVERLRELADEALVAVALMGEFAAFDVLVLRYRSAVLATVSRLVSSRALAEDICQEAFLRAFKALPQLRDPARFGSWLHAIARREVIRWGSGEARAAHAPLDDLILQHSQVLGESGWDVLEREEEAEAVRRAMAALPEEFQIVLTLRYWSDMPLERIASFLGRPLSTVKWRLHQARVLMRRRLTHTLAAGTCPLTRKEDESLEHRSKHRTATHRADAREDCRAGAGSPPDP
jgi:RNA polymerase sigma-70 factor, ECF subfamily